MIARLALENGVVITGESFGSQGETTGEIVFNTSLTGYQEILTDPSYCGQIVTMTNPMIGNHGVNPDDLEAAAPHAAGMVVKEYIEAYSNFRGRESLGAWLRKHNVVGIEGVDTRMLTRIIREVGAMRAVISTTDPVEERLVDRARRSPRMEGLDLTRTVSCRTPYRWDDVDNTPFALRPPAGTSRPDDRRFTVVVYDYGVKRNILRRLTLHGCKLIVVPSDHPVREVLKLKPDGIFLSNGPGDPAAASYAVENIRHVIGVIPVFGICLGHQLLAIALGARTFKLKFGHRGANHPVKNLLTGEIEITSQNHGFAVDPDTLDPSMLEVTHINLNDGTNEGFRHRHLPLFCVQYHPEASPGPHDSDHLFRNFVTMMKERPVVPS